MTTVADVMTASVTPIAPTATLREAARLMRELNVGVLPVCEAGKPVGLVTDRDLVVRGLADGRESSHAAAEAMTRELHTVRATDTVDAALRQMQAAQVRRLLVVDDAGRLAGIVSLGDLALRQNRSLDDTLEKISSPQGA